MSTLKGIRREIKDATGLQIKPGRITRVIELIERGWDNSRIRGYEGKNILGVEINYSTLTRIKENFITLKSILEKYNPVKTLSASRDEITDTIAKTVEEDGNHIFFDYIDSRREQYGIPPKTDAFALQRLLTLQVLENEVPEYKLSINYLEDLGLTTPQALNWLHDFYALKIPRYNAQILDVNLTPIGIRPFEGLSQYVIMLRWVITKEQNPPIDEGGTRIKFAKTNLINMPEYYSSSASKLYAEGLEENDHGLILVSQALTGFALWRGVGTKAEKTGNMVIDLDSFDDVLWLESIPEENIYAKHFYDSIRGITADEGEHKELVKKINDTIAQERERLVEDAR